VRDVRYAIRSLFKAPAFTAVIVLILALGIGATTAIFSIVHAVLLRPVPFVDPERLAVLWETDRDSGTLREPASFPDYMDFKARSRTFAQLAAFMADEVNLVPAGGDPVRLATLRITHDLMPTLGVRLIAGRGFAPGEDRPGAGDLVIVAASLAERLFGSPGRAVGQTMRIDDRPSAIVGVVADRTDFGVMQVLSAAAYSRGFADRGVRTPVVLWTPLQADAETYPRTTHPIFVLGRLAEGVSVGTAQREMVSIAADLERAYPENAARGVNVEALETVVFGPSRPALYLLMGAVALVLLVACVNVANLMLARNAGRVHEAAIRTALGASRTRILRERLVENMLLAGGAAICGVALAWLGVRALAALAPADVPRIADAAIDLPVLAVSLITTVLVGLGFGFVAVVPRGAALQPTLMEAASRTSAGRARANARRALVVAELGLAVVLVCGAGLLIRSFMEILSVDPGFRAAGVLKAEYQLPASRYPADFRLWPAFKEQHAFTAAVLSRAAALPGVEAVAVAGHHPLDPGFTTSFSVVGRETEAQSWPELSIRRVTPGYFRTVGLELVRGRLLAESDTTTSAPVALINLAAARRFFADRDPIGARVRFWGTPRMIVGVVTDERFHGLTEAAPIAAYTPLSQTPSANGAGALLLRTSAPPETVANAAIKAIREIDPALAVFGVETMTEAMSRSVGQRRFTMLLLGAFAFLALLLAAIGVHGVLSYGVVQRRREIGIRMAIGARTTDVIRLFVREGLMLAAAGTILGLAGAAALSRYLDALLFGVAPTDPATFAGVGVVLTAVALAAIAIPVRRAAQVDPVTALRSD
jgi:putative ABC transport system permease protein